MADQIKLEQPELEAIATIRRIGFSGDLGGGVSLRTDGISVASTNGEKLNKLKGAFTSLGGQINEGVDAFNVARTPDLLGKLKAGGITLTEQVCGCGPTH